MCRNCLAGRRHLCKDTKGVGVNRDGAFAEYLCIPASNAVHVDPAIPLDVLSCFDPLGNATHTALQYDLVGEDVLITGAGPIGCMAAAIARQCRRPEDRGHRREPRPARARAADGRHPRRSTSPGRSLPDVQTRARDEGGL